MPALIPSAVIRMDGRATRVLLATADRNGTPHLASAGELSSLPGDRVTVHYWFCPQSLANLRDNPRCSLVLWNTELDEGFQLVGTVEALEELAMMDGYTLGESQRSSLPQVKYRLRVAVEKVLEFKHAPHSDLSIAPAFTND